ncbi:MAG: FtsL-like putative cell division protein [Bacteroidota bacterium]
MANRFKKIEEEEEEYQEEVEIPVEKEKEAVKERTPINPKYKGAFKGFREILGGEMLSKSSVIQQFPFLLMMALFAGLYIYNNNVAEKNLIKIERTKKELIELRYEYISSKADMMDSLKQSMVLKKLETMGIKESNNPPHKIYLNTTKSEKK